jgi:hypothetical protein
MVESIVKEGQMILEMAEELKQGVRRSKDSYHEMESNGRAFYKLMEDRSNLMSQLTHIEGLLEELERAVNQHAQEIESLIE